MSAADVTTGFFGKLPATGDFVTRRLPHDFVRDWDRWISSHLVPLQAAGLWADGTGLRFLLGPAAMGPMAGVVVPSADRIGRLFPLTLAARFERVTTELLETAADWFAALDRAATAARQGAFGADALAAELAAYALPEVPAGAPVERMVFATADTGPWEIDQAAPRAALERLVMAGTEVS